MATLKTNLEHCDYFVIIFLAGLTLNHAVFVFAFSSFQVIYQFFKVFFLLFVVDLSGVAHQMGDPGRYCWEGGLVRGWAGCGGCGQYQAPEIWPIQITL